jgi:manganese/zinc/iron transport system permease protein
MWTYNTAVVLMGASLLGLLCGLVGCFAVLRRRALLGDVTAHAAMPGLALAFILTNTRALPILLAGALASGLFGVAALTYLRRHTRTKDDAAMGIILAVLFGAGMALFRYVQNSVQDGSISGLNSFIFGKTAGMVMADVFLTSMVCVVAILAIILLFKEFQLVCFDAGFAQSLGWRVARIDFTILALLCVAVVVGLPMVGVVMVAALTIIPPVAARFWTESLKVMLVLAGLFGILSAVAGVLVSATAPGLPSGPMIVLAAAVLFGFSTLMSPSRGVLAKALQVRRLRLDYGVLTLLRYLAQGAAPADRAFDDLARLGVRYRSQALNAAITQGLAQRQGEQLVLSDEGRKRLEATAS